MERIQLPIKMLIVALTHTDCTESVWKANRWCPELEKCSVNIDILIAIYQKKINMAIAWRLSKLYFKVV